MADTKLKDLRMNCYKHHVFCAYVAFGKAYALRVNAAQDKPFPNATINGWCAQWKRQIAAGETV